LPETEVAKLPECRELAAPNHLPDFFGRNIRITLLLLFNLVD
jgi:hypothetical protein